MRVLRIEEMMDTKVICEMCGTKMLPNMLNEFKTGNVIAVHVCPHCGLVSRDGDEQPAADEDDEKEYAAPDENWQWQPPES
jgi:rubrerythrin